MVSETVLGATLGVGGAVVGSILTGGISWLNTRQKIEAENQRHRSEYYLGKKVDALIGVHSALQQARQVLGEYGQNPPLSWEEYQEKVVPVHEQYWSAFKTALIFLDDEQERLLRETWTQFCTMKGQIEVMVDSPTAEPADVSWNNFLDSIRNAEDMLVEEINDPIERFESGLNSRFAK